MSLADSEERFSPHQTGDIALDHLARYAMAVTQVERDDEVLDLASGEGYGSALLAVRARRVTGVDNCAEAVAHADQRYGGPNLRFITASADRLPCNDGFFDKVVSFETIEHVANPDAVFVEIKRVLRPGGTLIMSTPDKVVFNAHRAAPNRFHLHEFTRDEFQDTLRDYFRNVQMLGQTTARYSLIASAASGQPISFTIAERTNEDLQIDIRPVIQRPMYLIGVASDGPLEALPTVILR